MIPRGHWPAHGLAMDGLYRSPSVLTLSATRSRDLWVMRRTRGPTRVPVWSGRRTSGERSPSFGPTMVKSLGGSSRVLLANGHRAVAGTERGVPANHDGVFHALVRGTALDMHGQRPLCRFR